MSKKTVSGKSLSGEERHYTFNLINAKQGTRIFHEYVSVIIQLIPESADFGGLNIDTLKQIVAELNEFLPFDKLELLAALLLGGGSVGKSDRVYEIDADGFGDYADGDPLEVYTALLYALKLNFPKYINPLFQALEEQGEEDDSTQSK